MKLPKRRILYLVFALLFCIAVPFALLYSLGIHYNPKKGILENQSGIFVTYSPSDAQFYINNQVYARSSPADVAGLHPGRYYINLQKENYFSWEKRIEILPLQTQSFTNITLFPKASPIEITTKPPVVQTPHLPITHFSLVLDKQNIIVESLLTQATTTLPLTESGTLFEIPRIDALIQFAPQSGVFTITPHSPKHLEPHRFQNVKGFRVQNSTLLFWNDFELWTYSNSDTTLDLVTRNSHGIVSADFTNEQYLLFATGDGEIIAIERESPFGRFLTTLGSIQGTKELSVIGNIAFIQTSSKRLFSLRLK